MRVVTQEFPPTRPVLQQLLQHLQPVHGERGYQGHVRGAAVVQRGGGLGGNFFNHCILNRRVSIEFWLSLIRYNSYTVAATGVKLQIERYSHL